MPRIFLACLVTPLLPAAVWPEQIWEHKRTSREPIRIDNQAVWQEYGLEEAERAAYSGPGGDMRVAAWRLKDPTSALGVYQWTKPVGGAPATLWKTGVEFPGRAFLQVGNYILDFQGRVPPPDDFAKLYVQLPRMDQSSLPSLPGFLPREGLVPGSERFVIGPAALDAFDPGISPSLAGFSLGAELQLGKYRGKSGDVPLALFSYPTPQMARDKAAEFQRLPGAVVKRTGPIVAVSLNPASPDDAERLLAKVNYQATVTWNEPVKKEENFGDFLLNVFIFIGVLLGLTVVAGLGWFGIRFAYRRATGSTGEEASVMRLGIDK
jgi:hypothetical protein